MHQDKTIGYHYIFARLCQDLIYLSKQNPRCPVGIAGDAACDF